MLVLPAAIGTFLLVNLLCACVALGVGFAAGVWFFGSKMTKLAVNERATKPRRKQMEQKKRAVERAAMAASRVADLAHTVASDVGDHAAKMNAISKDLAGIDRGAEHANAAVFTAVDQMVAANTKLQQRLEDAEKQLAAQAAEIKVHESEARTDSLTGLANRRAFDDELKRRLSEWQRRATTCSLVLLDIDFFKRFNDRHGHQIGDKVLRQMAKVLRAQSREMDLPCRYGGEEFGVILPATDAATACKVAEQIRAAIETCLVFCNDKTLNVTCSLGVAAFMADDDVARLIRRADDALYVSKRAGRNCGHWNTGRQHVPITTPETAEPSPLPAEDVTNPEEGASVAETDNRVETPSVPTGATFVQMLKRRVAESHRFGIPISVMYLKIEEFDIVNHKYGSPAARQMVSAAASEFQKALREMDIIANLENGEFVVMFPGSAQTEVCYVVKRMRAITANCILRLVDRKLQIRFRHGIAELKPNETAKELLARARQTLNAALSPEPVEG